MQWIQSVVAMQPLNDICMHGGGYNELVEAI